MALNVMIITRTPFTVKICVLQYIRRPPRQCDILSNISLWCNKYPYMNIHRSMIRIINLIKIIPITPI